MDEKQHKELAILINRYSNREGENETLIPGVALFKAITTDTSLPGVYNPSLCFIAQGHKQVMLGNEIYHYGPSEYLTVSVDLPLIGQITEATKDKPYLVIKIDISLQQLSELLTHIGYPTPTKTKTKRGIFIGKSDEKMRGSVLRLAQLLETPEDIPVLAPQIIREILYRVLRSEHGDMVAQITLTGSHMQRISCAIQKIKSNYDELLSVDALAALTGMSVSSFHAHFKSVTAMSPLQFQKSLRLMEARNLMVTDGIDAASTAYRVGYESPSQFSREYARMFGNPPGRDISLLKQHDSLLFLE